MREQFLADGGHFERSPMYHAIGLVDCLDVLNLISAAGPEIESTILGRGVHRAENFIYCHSDYTPVMEGAYVVVKGADGAQLASLELMGSPEIEVQTGECFPQFGILLTNTIVRLQVRGRLPLSFGYRIRKSG